MCESYQLREGFCDTFHSLGKGIFDAWTKELDRDLRLLDNEDAYLSRIWCRLAYHYHLDPTKEKRLSSASLAAHYDSQRVQRRNNSHADHTDDDDDPFRAAQTTIEEAITDTFHLISPFNAHRRDFHECVTLSGHTYEEVAHLACLVAAKHNVDYAFLGFHFRLPVPNYLSWSKWVQDAVADRPSSALTVRRLQQYISVLSTLSTTVRKSRCASDSGNSNAPSTARSCEEKKRHRRG